MNLLSKIKSATTRWSISDWLLVCAGLLVIGVAFSSLGGWLGVSYQKRAAQKRDVEVQKKLATSELKLIEQGKVNRTQAEELRKLHALIDERGKNLDKQATQIETESKAERDLIEQSYEREKKQLEQMANTDACTQCKYVRDLYIRYGLQPLGDCANECTE